MATGIPPDGESEPASDRQRSTDGQLLQSFAERGNDDAFAKLMEIHGAMVHGVCLRILGNHHDAEEACQASFLVLARKARSISSREAVANWLYGVARRTALKAKCLRAKRRVRERPMTAEPVPAATPPDSWAEIAPCLDLELGGLPEKYRAAVVLCDLEGQSYSDAARQLKTTEQAISMRLTRGRRMLAGRLARHGLVLSAATVAALLARNSSSAWASTTLIVSTFKAASRFAAGHPAVPGAVSANVAALAQGVLKSMFMTTVLKTTAAAAVLVGIGLGAGGLIHRMHAGEAAAPNTAKAEKDGTTKGAAQPGKDQEEQLKKELEKLQGTWILTAAESAGNNVPEQRVKDDKGKLKISGSRFAMTFADQKGETLTLEGALRIDLTQQPPTMDWHGLKSDKELGIPGGKIPEFWGIYKVAGDTFTYCCVEENKERPGEFKTKRDIKLAQRMWTFKREKP